MHEIDSRSKPCIQYGVLIMCSYLALCTLFYDLGIVKMCIESHHATT